MSWEKKTLDQLGSVSRGKSKHRPRNDPKLFGGQYPFVQTADVKNANFYITEYSDTYNETGLAQSKLWDVGTLCITIAANIADTGILAIPACFPDSIIGFIPYGGISDVRFVKYCFDMLQQDCKQISQGTAQDNLSWQKLSTIEFPAPPIETQRRIADILSAYDDLIENNRKQIKLLEEAAQRLYKEWFVDLRFPGHEHTKIVDGVPEGWERKTVAECLIFHRNGGWGKEAPIGKHEYPGKVIRGTDIEEIKCGHFKDIPMRYHTEGDIKKRMLHIHDIVFELSNGNINNIGRSLFIDNFVLQNCGNNTICASFCKLLRPANPLIALTLYLEIQDMQLSGRMLPYKKNGANGINNFAFEEFLAHSLLVPKNEKLVEPFVRIKTKVSTIQGQLALLEEARDRLLPKLMSGEIEV
nr:restriction endonuclease subunit S [uncultured Agathobaculum sp.]